MGSIGRRLRSLLCGAWERRRSRRRLIDYRGPLLLRIVWIGWLLMWAIIALTAEANDDLDNRFDLQKARRREAARRRRLLGETANNPYSYRALRDRAQAVGITTKVLWEWWHAFQRHGIDGLLPAWEPLLEQSQAIASERYAQLNDLADVETIDQAQIEAYAATLGWKTARLQRWLRRYREHGLWALAPENDPDKPRRASKPLRPPRDPGTFTDHDWDIITKRRAILGEYAEREKVSDKEARARAAECGISVSLFWDLLRRFRAFNLPGLADKTRSDKGVTHGVSPVMTKIIIGIRLANKDYPVYKVWRDACGRARKLGEKPPSKYQVRKILKGVPKIDVYLADGRIDKFYNELQATLPTIYHRIVYQIDITPVDVLAKDIRKKRYRTKSGEIRPWLVTCIESESGVVLAARLAYKQFDRFAIAAVLRDAMLVTTDHSYGGIPQEVWIDGGKQFNARMIKELCETLHIKLHLTRKPNHKGVIERFFRTLTTRCWAGTKGYINSNTKDRNPTAKAELTVAQLAGIFWNFVEDEYHRNVDEDDLSMTPLEYWNQHVYALPADPRILDILLLESGDARVIREGIKFEGGLYWHPEVVPLIGTDVQIRAGPAYENPDEIEVFHNDQWVCTAFEVNSEIGKNFDRSFLNDIQNEQLTTSKQRIAQAQANLASIDTQIVEAEKVQKGAGERITDTDSHPKTSESRERAPSLVSAPKKPRPKVLDALDLQLARQRQQQVSQDGKDSGS